MEREDADWIRGIVGDGITSIVTLKSILKLTRRSSLTKCRILFPGADRFGLLDWLFQMTRKSLVFQRVLFWIFEIHLFPAPAPVLFIFTYSTLF